MDKQSNSSRKIAFIIQARTGSTRLPDKIIKPFYKKKSILEIIIERIKERFNDDIWVATSVEPSDDKILSITKRFSVHLYRGSNANVLSRFCDIISENDYEYVLRICSDNPFLNMDYTEELLSNLNAKNASPDYISFYTENKKKPVIKTHLGLFCELVKADTLLRVQSLTSQNEYLEHVTNYIYTHENKFLIGKIDLPSVLKDLGRLRLTVDTQEDFDVASHLYEQVVKSEFNYNLKELLGIYKRSESLKEKMELQIQNNSK